MAPKKAAGKAGGQKKAEPAKAAAAPKAAAKAPAKTGDGKGVYVKNLNFPGINNDSVKATFKQCGNVDQIRLRRRKYAIVFFKDAAGVSKAKEITKELERLRKNNVINSRFSHRELQELVPELRTCRIAVEVHGKLLL